MVNHARTLLLNLSGSGAPYGDFPGEDFIPPDYRPIVLPSSLQSIRNVLFGPDPDRAMLNYRVREYLALLHATDLGSYVLRLDPRVTYLPLSDHLFLKRSPAARIHKLAGSSELYVLGDYRLAADDNHLLHEWRITNQDSTTILIKKIAPIPETSTITHSTADGLTEPFPLPGTDLQFRLQPTADASWSVSLLARPRAELGQVAATLQAGFRSAETEIFSSTANDRQLFASLWREHDELPYKLGGFLLGYIYRLEELRTGK